MVHKFLYFLRWQAWEIIKSIPNQIAFVLRGRKGALCGLGTRLRLASQLTVIHLSIPCMHSPSELLTIVEDIVELPESIPGVIVECGTYLGGSSAKLSLAVKFAGRRLIVCDSFQGLSEVGHEDYVLEKKVFNTGDYSAQLEEVRKNIQKFGEIAVVEFVPGWYQESLSRLDGVSIATLILDVDLQESIKTCLELLWKSVAPGCKVFVHDVDRPPVVAPFIDESWWSSHIGLPPPLFVGAGNGISRQSPLLGYAIKS